MRGKSAMNQGFDQQLHEMIASGNEIGAIKLLRQQQKLPLGTARERVAALSRDIKGPEPQDGAYILTSIGGFVLMAVVALSGFLVIATSGHLIDYWHSADWPTTSGTITRSQKNNTHGAGNAYGPVVEYRYEVDDKQYHSERWGFPLIDAGPGSGIERVLARYPRGASVAVYYDPEQPRHALLDTDLIGLWIRLLAFVISLPLYLWYRGFARRVEAHSRLKAVIRK